MPDLKLAKLPDRTPVKHVIHVFPDLNDDLSLYANLYRDAYGQAVSVQDLIPAMLRSFLDSDREFIKARKDAGKE
ncbi:DUF2274 domain-containing protein [Sphingomonas sp. DT-204]|uniref:DUF2274 domain-containing protein n=1 Tax=Sphingomonas sp. DT-204 TaxID=3396166 RepID=UPI003F1CAD54